MQQNAVLRRLQRFSLLSCFVFANNYDHSAEIAPTGQAPSQAPQSMQVSGFIIY